MTSLTESLSALGKSKITLLGVGVPVGIVAAVGIYFIFIRKRSPKRIVRVF